MSKNNHECLCGKKKGVLNSTNWTRHITSCKVMKNKNTCSDISSFFKIPATATASNSSNNELNTTKRQRLGKLLLFLIRYYCLFYNLKSLKNVK